MTAPVKIRTYNSTAAFQEGATQWAAAGWRVASQSSGSKISTAGSLCVALGALLLVAGFLVWFPLLVAAIVLIIIGAVSKQQTYTVTYQPADTK